MKILKVKTKRPPHKFIAVSILASMHEYMSLYCIAKQTTKSRIVMTFLNPWFAEMRLRETDESLIQETIENYTSSYVTYDKYADMHYEEYITLMEEELERGGLKTGYTTAILEKIKPKLIRIYNDREAIRTNEKKSK